jgi:hypothetical protein
MWDGGPAELAIRLRMWKDLIRELRQPSMSRFTALIEPSRGDRAGSARGVNPRV